MGTREITKCLAVALAMLSLANHEVNMFIKKFIPLLSVANRLRLTLLFWISLTFSLTGLFASPANASIVSVLGLSQYAGLDTTTIVGVQGTNVAFSMYSATSVNPASLFNGNFHDNSASLQDNTGVAFTGSVAEGALINGNSNFNGNLLANSQTYYTYSGVTGSYSYRCGLFGLFTCFGNTFDTFGNYYSPSSVLGSDYYGMFFCEPTPVTYMGGLG